MAVNIRNESLGGWPSGSGAHQRASAFCRRDRVTRFKVGITSDPRARASQSDYQEGYDEMVLLYRTNSLKNVRELERRLTKYYEDENLCMNTNQGGGGNHGGPPFYLYVVLKRRK